MASETEEKPRILLVDDEPNMLTGLRRILSYRYDITMASNADEALDIVENSPPFCVAICDIRMPGMNGIELLGHFREKIPEMVRMVLSGTDEFDTAISAVNGGEIFRFHTKPVATDVLLASIDAAVERYKQNLESVNGEDLNFAEKMFSQALNNKEFELYLQPQFDSRTQSLTGAEALIRWNHPHLGFLGPGAFLANIENIGKTTTLTGWVLENACATLSELHNTCCQDLTIAVNITAIDLSDATFSTRVADCLNKYSIAPESIELELVEDMAMDDESQPLQTLSELSDLGICLSLDDFGTGYSAFGRLRHLPIRKLKIDRIFIAELHQNTQALTIVKSIVELARELNLSVIAEGVETKDQAKILRNIGCPALQGFFYGKPMSKPDFIKWYENQNCHCPQ